MTDTQVGPPEQQRDGKAPKVMNFPEGSGKPTDPPAYPGLRLAGLLAGMVAVGVLWPWVMAIIVAVVVMIFLHELGHYVMAKRAGMKVTEFFLFFGPKLWSFRRGETEYGVKLIPAGAYVRIVGMHNLEEVAPEDEGRSYRQKTFWQRFGVAVAGSAMHFVLAFVLIYAAFVSVGTPGGASIADTEKTWVVGPVVADSAADDAGLQPGDEILSVDGQSVETFDDLQPVVEFRKGETVTVRWRRDGEVFQEQVELRPFRSQGRTACCLGIGRDLAPTEQINPVAAVPRTFETFGEVAVLSATKLPEGVANLGRAFVGEDEPVTGSPGRSDPSDAPAATSSDGEASNRNRLVSILGVVDIGAGIGERGELATLVMFFGLVNISIGMINLIPLLPFDGGHVAIAVYEKIQERRLNRRRYFADVGRMMPVVYLVFGVLLVVGITTMYLDIANPIID